MNAEYAQAYFDECMILKAEIAKLLAERDKPFAVYDQLKAENARLRAALEDIKTLHWETSADIARRALDSDQVVS